MRTGFFATTAYGLIVLTLVAGCAIDPESRIHITTMATFIDDDPERDVDDDLAGYHVGVGKSFGEATIEYRFRACSRAAPSIITS